MPRRIWRAARKTPRVTNTSMTPESAKAITTCCWSAPSDAGVFGDPVPSVLHSALPDEGKEDAGHARRRAHEYFYGNRPGAKEPRFGAYREGLTATPCIQVGSFDCQLEYEEEMHAGYVLERLPKMCAKPSCVRVRKLNSVAGWAKHGIIYEFASKEGFDRDYAPAVASSPLGFNGHSVVPQPHPRAQWAEQRGASVAAGAQGVSRRRNAELRRPGTNRVLR